MDRRGFIKGAAGLAGGAMVASHAGSALAQMGALELDGVRPIGGHLAASRNGRRAYFWFDYPGKEEVWTVQVHVTPDNVFQNAGFNVYGPNGSRHIAGGVQRTLTPNVSADIVSRNVGRHIVEIYNYNEAVPIDYQVRLVRGGREGQLVAPVRGFGSAANAPLFVYVGVGGRGEGIHTYTMDPNVGSLAKVDLAPVAGPGWVTLDPSQRFLYAAISNARVAGYAVDPVSGKLAPLNVQPTGTGGAAHISVDPSGRYVVTASWGAGTVSVLPIGADGQLGAAHQVVTHSGEPGPHADQTQARAHQIPWDPSGRWAVVTDLGLDRIYVYSLDAAGKLVSNTPPFTQVARGRGPRHLAFHPNGRLMYVINELDSTMSAFHWDSAAGVATEIHTLSSLPEGWTGRKWSAQVLVHPSGRWVYGSNRGSGGDSDDIAIYAIDEPTGRMSKIGHAGTLGKVPRNFNIDPSGRFLLCAHQDGDSIVTFWIDPESGKLTPTGQVSVVNPICIQFAEQIV